MNKHLQCKISAQENNLIQNALKTSQCASSLVVKLPELNDALYTQSSC